MSAVQLCRRRQFTETPFAREIGDRRNEGIWLGNLGIIYSDLGQVEKAIKCYGDALMIGEEIRDPKIIRFYEKTLNRSKIWKINDRL